MHTTSFTKPPNTPLPLLAGACWWHALGLHHPYGLTARRNASHVRPADYVLLRADDTPTTGSNLWINSRAPACVG